MYRKYQEIIEQNWIYKYVKIAYRVSMNISVFEILSSTTSYKAVVISDWLTIWLAYFATFFLHILSVYFVNFFCSYIVSAA